MKRNWNEDELLEHFVVLPIERKLIGNKTGASRLGFAVLLKYFQQEARFPSKRGSNSIVDTNCNLMLKNFKTLIQQYF